METFHRKTDSPPNPQTASRSPAQAGRDTVCLQPAEKQTQAAEQTSTETTAKLAHCAGKVPTEAQKETNHCSS